jgi:hypothetical protein
MEPPVVSYQSPHPKPPKYLTLEEGPGVVMVIFPTRGAPLLELYIQIGFATVCTIAPIVVLTLIWSGLKRTGIPTPNFLPSSWGQILLDSIWEWSPLLFLWITAIVGWRRYRKWGQVPRMLSATKEGITHLYVGWFGLRKKFWPAKEITGIESVALRWDLNPRKTARDLVIRRGKGSALRFRLSTRDADLPGQIERRMRAAIGLPSDGN